MEGLVMRRFTVRRTPPHSIPTGLTNLVISFSVNRLYITETLLGTGPTSSTTGGYSFYI